MTDIEYDILDLAVDDYFLLAELVWWVRAHSSLETDEEIIPWVAPAVDRLLRQGLLGLYRARWPSSEYERVDVNLDRWQEVITWQPEDDDGWGYWVAATGAGEQAYREEARRRAEAGYPWPYERLTPY